MPHIPKRGATMTAPDFPAEFLAELDRAVLNRDGETKGHETIFRCPFDGHEDAHPSARWNESKATFFCDVCAEGGGALDLADLLGVEWPELEEEGAADIPPCATATLQHSGCTLVEYAAAKKLPLDYLQSIGLTELVYLGKPSVRMSYARPDGTEATARYRVQMEKTEHSDRFRWKKGSKAMPYGLDRLDGYRAGREVSILEGESDCHTAWFHGLPAIGLPGAGTWNEQRDADLFDGFDRINILIEPDQGGAAVRKWLEVSKIRDRAWLMEIPEHKDVSGLHLNSDDFTSDFATARDAATRWASIDARESEQAAIEAWELCKHLATEPRILDLAADVVERRGVAGERRFIQLLYLIVTSRVLARPISAVIKGPSSAGKSFMLERTLEMFPASAYYALSGMSERALAYDDEPLVHRFLVIYEAAGLTGDFASYLMRSLLSEGRIKYVTVEKTSEGLKPKTIERAGPTGLLVTTTAVHLHPENETRLLSIPATDSQDQTRLILASIASPCDDQEDLATWHALQTWIDHADHEVTIPFAAQLATMIPPIAVRLRRDFGLILNLIKSHAILHQAARTRDDHGRIVAGIQDYGVVHELVDDLVSSGIEATVPATVRETVAAVRTLIGDQPRQPLLSQVHDEGFVKTSSVTEIAKVLNLDKSATSRRVRVAIDGGYLRNDEQKRGRPAKIALGEPLPEDHELLPSPKRLEECCTVAVLQGGITGAPSSENVVEFRQEADFAYEPTGTAGDDVWTR